MFRRLDDFASDWTTDAEVTLKLLDALSDESLPQAVTEGRRTLGRLAWHLAETIPEMMGHTAGIPGVEGPGAGLPTPASADEIRAAYRRAAHSLVPALRAAWTDEMLDEYIPMYGQQWKRGTTLSILIQHQAHHRGQMTVLMRQAGLRVPGVYGPSAEEWEAMGIPALT